MSSRLIVISWRRKSTNSHTNTARLECALVQNRSTQNALMSIVCRVVCECLLDLFAAACNHIRNEACSLSSIPSLCSPLDFGYAHTFELYILSSSAPSLCHIRLLSFTLVPLPLLGISLICWACLCFQLERVHVDSHKEEPNRCLMETIRHTSMPRRTLVLSSNLGLRKSHVQTHQKTFTQS